MRILVVDDDETFCRLLVEILESEGIEAVYTTDGFVGYETSTHDPYDLFIIDVRMPVLLGTDLAAALREEKPRAKIILVSAFADDHLLKTSKTLGAPLLSKPFGACRLLDAVEEVLSGSQKPDH